ncbi:Flp pilus assembly protein CpaB [Nocardioides donggukensis]|uniref:Flp pilus assembly protein CpaB n=1 Tax=Nocardioides donggukensis TaxID=2774019 RepID=A0A927K7C6_9ACTN|nr:Flp pilus assembly protein CpaB [Nocardioides donggukensis]MBD8869156.1 Flp pilus assembly protein CpaB [Nocardioides donggukensis]
MDRRKILLVVAALIAALGTMLVFLYVQGADTRAKENVASVEVLKAVQPIQLGEAFDDAAAAGKFQLEEVPKDQKLDGAQTNLSALSGQVATTQILPNEQIVADRWAGSADPVSGVLAIPDGLMAVSVNLTDPARVAGFVNPGSEVSILLSASNPATQTGYARTLLQRVFVLGVGQTSTITSTKVTEEGEETTEQLPATLMTLAVDQEQAERIAYAANNGELSFGLLTEKSKVDKTPGITFANLFK